MKVVSTAIRCSEIFSEDRFEELRATFTSSFGQPVDPREGLFEMYFGPHTKFGAREVIKWRAERPRIETFVGSLQEKIGDPTTEPGQVLNVRLRDYPALPFVVADMTTTVNPELTAEQLEARAAPFRMGLTELGGLTKAQWLPCTPLVIVRHVLLDESEFAGIIKWIATASPGKPAPDTLAPLLPQYHEGLSSIGKTSESLTILTPIRGGLGVHCIEMVTKADLLPSQDSSYQIFLPHSLRAGSFTSVRVIELALWLNSWVASIHQESYQLDAQLVEVRDEIRGSANDEDYFDVASTQLTPLVAQIASLENTIGRVARTFGPPSKAIASEQEEGTVAGSFGNNGPILGGFFGAFVSTLDDVESRIANLSREASTMMGIFGQRISMRATRSMETMTRRAFWLTVVVTFLTVVTTFLALSRGTE